MIWTSALLTLALVGTALAKNDKNSQEDGDHNERAKTLYIWAGDQARVAPDFLTVINFDEASAYAGQSNLELSANGDVQIYDGCERPAIRSCIH
jgi:hypothetical protein